MKAVLLAGGSGTRLRPLSLWTNKHLLPIGRSPMVCHGIHKLKKAGILDIILVTSRQFAGSFAQVFGSGREYGVNLFYRLQEQPRGIAQALGLTRAFFSQGEKFVVLLGDNLFEDDLTDFTTQFAAQSQDSAMVLLKKVTKAKQYGVAEFNEQKQLVRIVEKPNRPISDACVTGIYFYDTSVFTKIDGLTPSERREVEITDVNNIYAANKKLTYEWINGWWHDAGTFPSLLQACSYFSKETLP